MHKIKPAKHFYKKSFGGIRSQSIYPLLFVPMHLAPNIGFACSLLDVNLANGSQISFQRSDPLGEMWIIAIDPVWMRWGFLKTHKRALTNCSTKVREYGVHLAVHGKGDLIGSKKG